MIKYVEGADLPILSLQMREEMQGSTHEQIEPRARHRFAPSVTALTGTSDQ